MRFGDTLVGRDGLAIEGAAPRSRSSSSRTSWTSRAPGASSSSTAAGRTRAWSPAWRREGRSAKRRLRDLPSVSTAVRPRSTSRRPTASRCTSTPCSRTGSATASRRTSTRTSAPRQAAARRLGDRSAGRRHRLPAGSRRPCEAAGRRRAPQRPRPVLYEELFDGDSYDPTGLVEAPRPVKDLDFTSGGAYAVYNWELFFHVPLTIAIHLSKNQRFERGAALVPLHLRPDRRQRRARRRSGSGRCKPFQDTDVELIEEILRQPRRPAPTRRCSEDTIDSIGAWKDAPVPAARGRPLPASRPTCSRR